MIRQPKNCFVTIEFPPDMGGVSKSSKRVVNYLLDAGYQIHVVLPALFGSIERCHEGRLMVHRVVVSIDADNMLAEYIEALHKKEHFALFHGFFLFKAYPCLLVADGRLPVIASFRGIDADWMFSDLYFSKARWILQSASWVTSVNNSSLIAALKIYDISGKCSFIFNPIISEGGKQWSLTKANAGVVGTLSTFRPKKNIPLLLDEYSILDRSSRKQLLLVGDFINKKKWIAAES